MEQLTIIQKQVSEVLNQQITNVLANQIPGMEKSFVMAAAIRTMQTMLTPEVMQDVMALQGSRLGFRTDQDKGGGYGLPIVKNCCIEALLLGVELVGNQFNIIAGNMYITREGFTHLLKNIPTLNYELTYTNITQSEDKSFGSVDVRIDWNINGVNESRLVNFPVNSNKFATADALKGKAERKAKCWLFNKIKGTNLVDGDVQEVNYVDVTPKQTARQQGDEVEYQKKVNFINTVTSSKQLLAQKKYMNTPDLQELFNSKLHELQTKGL